MAISAKRKTGNHMVFVQDTHHLTQLINNIKKVKGVTSAVRIDSN